MTRSEYGKRIYDQPKTLERYLGVVACRRARIVFFLQWESGDLSFCPAHSVGALQTWSFVGIAGYRSYQRSFIRSNPFAVDALDAFKCSILS